MNRVLIAVVLVLVFMAGTAQAADGKLYVSASGGLSLVDDLDSGGINVSFEPGFNIGGALGYDFGQFRAEGEIRHQSVDIDELDGISVPFTVELSALTFMANGYYDHEINNSPLTPYIGAGIGLVSSELDAGSLGSVDDEDFGYQFMVGLGFDITQAAILTAGYRYFGIADSELPNTHAFIFGARFMF